MNQLHTRLTPPQNHLRYHHENWRACFHHHLRCLVLATEPSACLSIRSTNCALFPDTIRPSSQSTQIENIDQETFILLFTSHTDKSCLRDLLSCKCFVGEAEVLVQNQLGI